MTRANSDIRHADASPLWRRAAVWAVAGALGAMFAAPAQRPAPLAASAAAVAAQPEIRGGIVNPADQRRQIIDELRKLNAAVAKLQEQLQSQGVNVRVTELPAEVLRERSADQP